MKRDGGRPRKTAFGNVAHLEQFSALVVFVQQVDNALGGGCKCSVRIGNAQLADHGGFLESDFFKQPPGLGVIERQLGQKAKKFGAGDQVVDGRQGVGLDMRRSEEHTSELQSLMRISYAV